MKSVVRFDFVLQGRRANLTDPATGEVLAMPPAFQHEIGDFVNGAISSGFQLQKLEEWRDGEEKKERQPPQEGHQTVPRLISFLFKKL